MVTYNNLDPHPNVITKWREIGYLPDSNRIPMSQSLALQMMGAGKVVALTDPASEDPRSPRVEKICVKTVEDPQRPIKRQIHKLYRIRNPEGVESFFWVQHLSGENFTGDKPVDCSQTVGRYIEPKYTKIKNRETGVEKITGHADGVPVFEIPFSNGKFTDPSTSEQASIEDLAKYVGDKAWFYVYTSGRKYELIGITLQQFISATYDELVYFAIHNAWEQKPPVESGKKKPVKADE